MVNLYLSFISSHFNNQNTEEEKFYPAECRQAAICLLGWKKSSNDLISFIIVSAHKRK